MPKLLQINSTANWGSTGKITEQIGELAISKGWDSYIAYGRYANKSKSRLIKIGSKLGMFCHLVESRLFDNHGLASRLATRRLIKEIKRINPDIIHLHNIHGYYINYKILFNYLNSVNTPVVWTLHDCWAFTGHCAHFIGRKCELWKTECLGFKKCHDAYPKSIINNVNHNYRVKKSLFTSLGNRLTIVPVSKWLASQTEQSFLCKHRIRYIYNGVSTEIFTRLNSIDVIHKNNIKNIFTILGVASAWSEGKGLSDYYKLRKELSNAYQIILVGLTDEQIKQLPEGIIGIKRTQSQRELAELYSMSDVVLSLSRAETFGLTIAEGASCGTPAVVYNTTAVPELITPQTGIIVDKVGDIDGVINAIKEIESRGKQYYSDACRKYAEEHFDKDKCFAKYIDLYNELLNNTK